MQHAGTEMIVEATLGCEYVTSQGTTRPEHGVRFLRAEGDRVVGRVGARAGPEGGTGGLIVRVDVRVGAGRLEVVVVRNTGVGAGRRSRRRRVARLFAAMNATTE